MIDGVLVSTLKRIHHPKGDILHGLKASDIGYDSFGEAYFSSIAKGEIKGWKKHSVMVMNLVVPVGGVKFVIFDDRKNSGSYGEYCEFIVGEDNYSRLTVPPGVWMAFEGKGGGLNLVLNIASIEHDPSEAQDVMLDELAYDW
jgi:dTDP-4-dehydrorhamnose 3,5-epimerase